MQIEQNSPNFLKVVAAEGANSSPQKFIQQLQLGELLKGQVIQVYSEGTKALLNIGGQKIVVQGDASFKTGQTISAKVEQIFSSPVLKIIPSTDLGRSTGNVNGGDISGTSKQGVTIQLSSGKSSSISYFSKHELDYLQFSEGQTYKGKVEQVIDSKNAIIKINNRNFFAQTVGTNSLKPGDQIPVIAEQNAKGLFHFLQASGPVIKRVDAGAIKPYLSAQQPFGEMIAKLSSVTRELLPNVNFLKLDPEKLAQLNQTLQLLSPGTGKSPNAQLLREQVDASGINYEAKVKQFLETGVNSSRSVEVNRDLKGLLLDMIQKMEDQSNQAKGFSSAQLQMLKDNAGIFRQAVDNIELQQITNQLARQDNQSLLLQIPNPYGQGNPTLKLYIRPSEDETSEKKGGGKKKHNLVFFLDLSKLGNLRVDSQISQSRLSVKIQVENQAIGDFIDARIEEFKSRLGDLGFQAELTCSVEDEIDRDFVNDLPATLQNDKSRLLDITT